MDDSAIIGYAGLSKILGVRADNLRAMDYRKGLPITPIGHRGRSRIYATSDVYWWLEQLRNPKPNERGADYRFEGSYYHGKTLLEVITSNYSVTEAGCFNWNGHKNRAGYGQLRLWGGLQRVTRLVAKYVMGEDPTGLDVRHKCDNPACINPQHLETGTRAQNVADMVERGRQLIGSNCPWAKFTKEQVVAIRKASADGITHVSLAREYEVHVNTIYEIVARKTYK